MQPKSVNRHEKGIQIIWQDDHVCVYPIKYLRRHCPCAVCKEIPGRVDEMIPEDRLPPGNLEIKNAQPIGWYALQFVFSDGHATGIYSYEFLRRICPEKGK